MNYHARAPPVFVIIAAIPQFAGATVPPAMEPAIKVNTSTGLFVDGYGRARFFHGVNAVEKVAPSSRARAKCTI